MKLKDKWKWIAKDHDGSIWLFEYKPTFKDSIWTNNTSGNMECIDSDIIDLGDYCSVDSKSSLREIVDGEVDFEPIIPVDTLVKVHNGRLYYYSHREGKVHYVFKRGCTSKTIKQYFYKSGTTIPFSSIQEIVDND